MPNKEELSIENLELVGLEKVTGEFENEEGKRIPYKIYKVKVKNKYNGLVMKAKFEKVFNDYVEDVDSNEY